jgi:hypothetical protein
MEGNGALTAPAGVPLRVLLVAEGARLLAIHRLLAVELFIGLLPVPPLHVEPECRLVNIGRSVGYPVRA